MHPSAGTFYKSRDVDLPGDILCMALSTAGFLIAQSAVSRLLLKPIARYFLPSPPAESPPIRDHDSAIDLEEFNNNTFGKLPESELDLPPTPPSRDAGGQLPPELNLISSHTWKNGHVSIKRLNNTHNTQSTNGSCSPSRTQQQLGHLVASALPDPLMLTEYDVKRNTPLRHRKNTAADGSDEDNNVIAAKNNNHDASTASAPLTPNAMARRNAVNALKDDRKKFQVASWKLAYTSFVSVLGVIVLSQESWACVPSQYFAGWQETMPKMSNMMKLYYFISFGNFAAQAIAIFFEPKLKDFWQMFFHHIITLNLIFFSYWMGFYRVGSVIVLLHDISDPLMELAKCCHYSNNELFANLFFASFAACFIYTRNWLFPRYIIYPITQYAYHEDGSPMPNRTVLGAFIVGLCLLEALHIFWATLILGMIKEAVSAGGVTGDARDTDECQ
ncbi:hypothetical protein SeMB42_g00551 [Synchytrium endobioticum]|uniref:TLC domain-containing protein n=1 Tax=Synchytrium endobioticum TaxID=286115 RepID=A0A507DFE7_9FUNG|nr:hypothetical protein SeLEV6574_g01167 [Synchytrium endobioticum]TPX53917.1 hypothetical protein SeMB42_g00551 [Synchytrium endobioticum]